MLCYRDMTFCSRSDQCDNKKCYRNFNEERKAGAIAWRGEGAPICYANMQTKDCGFKEIKYVFSKTKERDIKRSTEDTKGH